jgi:ketosteroid isomerase-like protein
MRLAGIFVLCTMAVGAAAETPTARRPATVGQALRAAHDAWLSAAKRGDVDSLLALNDEDAMVMVPGYAAAPGHKSVRDLFQRYLAKEPALANMDVSPTSVVLSSDGGYAIETTMMAGDVTVAGRGDVYFRSNGLNVWKRQKDGGWKIFRSSWSDFEGSRR